jgi:hypothetical protein
MYPVRGSVPEYSTITIRTNLVDLGGNLGIYINLETSASGPTRETAGEYGRQLGLIDVISLDPHRDGESRICLVSGQDVGNKVIDAVEMQRTGAFVPSHPLRLAGECTVSTIAGRVGGDGTGTFVESPMDQQTGRRAISDAHHKNKRN